ncbi:phage tail sheath subtilisin-like domain-containing protein [Peptostreptococcus equinus]|uniref:Phage tail sheath subtilisin-like domain-containing protein n=1 Tax=Peptostreptococcus equinus TaxID=3003601 RepID=A0ABY7JQS3_9FIRM|nr:phage tail sheath subtilisin-like domain-containing protein [Peptostreptococcus sp. CBA3647]WAW15455.1 phage tail sheath subtilisin-like domain-containing protein [Peptostreptococcus sp. CBA3647]
MALGGGQYTTTDKSLAGAYINSVSAARTLDLTGENGIVAIALEHNFGNQGELFKVRTSEFRENSLTIFGYSLFDEKLKGIRELIENSKMVYFYILNKTTKAENAYAIANKGGTRGNDITIKVQTNIDDPKKKDVITMLDYIVIDKQTVTTAKDLYPNILVTFKPDSLLELTAGTKLASGEDGTATNENHQDFLNKLETKSFNVLACMSTTKELQKLYITYTKRMRNEIGLKFATVVCEASDIGGDITMYDFEGVVVVKNKVKGEKVKGNELVPFTAAIYANAELGRSNLNRLYTGEYDVVTEFTQFQLNEFRKQGRFVYHQVGDSVRVLEDVNGLITTTDTKGSEFKDNQVIRVLDALAMADAKVFNEMYLGKVNIDKPGIESLQNKIVEIREAFLAKNALKAYDKKGIKVEEVQIEGVRGAVKVDSVITPAECFRQLYLTNYVQI